MLGGATWNLQALLDGEKAEIKAETPPWHLGAASAMAALKLLGPGESPGTCG